jgi:hypothetical protein
MQAGERSRSLWGESEEKRVKGREQREESEGERAKRRENGKDYPRRGF